MSRLSALFVFVLGALMVVVSLTAVADGKPEGKSVLPLGARAGHTTTVLIYGDNLAPKSIIFAKSVCTAKLMGVKPTDDKSKGRGTNVVTIELTVPASTPRDNVSITLEQADKTLVPASVAVVDDVTDEIQVKKPASTYQTAMPLPSKSVAITGTLDGDTADVFRFEAKAHEKWDVSLLCGRGGSLLDPVLRIRDSRHITLMLSAGDKKRDRHLRFSAPADGVFYIDITEAEAKGGAGYDYRLTVNCLQPGA